MGLKKNRAEAAFLVIAAAAGAFLRFYRIGKECLWFDEISTAWRVSLSFGGLTDEIARSMLFPPLYFFLLKAWGSLAGITPVALRAFSALWGIAAIPVAYFLAREMFGRKAAVVSSILLVFSSFNIYYSQEAKMYTMWWTLVLASNLFFVRAVKHGARWTDLWLYVVSTAGALWTHNFTLLVLAAQAIYLVAVSRPREMRGRWFIAYMAVALLFSPWVVIFLVRNLADPRSGGLGGALSLTWEVIEWIPVPTLRDFFLSFVVFASGMRFYAYDLDTWQLSWHMPFPLATYLCALAMALVLYPALSRREDRWRFPRLLALLILLPIAAAFLCSQLLRPVWQPRYLGFVSPLLFIALGYGYTLSSRKGISMAALIVLLVLNISILDFYYSDRVKKPWDELVVYLGPRVAAGDSLLFPHYVGRASFEYYWNLDEKRSGKQLRLEYPFFKSGDIVKRVADSGDVWLVLSYSAPRRGEQRKRDVPDVPGYRQGRMYFGNGLEIIHYTRERSGLTGKSG